MVRDVPLWFDLAQDGRVHFVLGQYDHPHPRVIDPSFDSSRHLGTHTPYVFAK